MQNKKKPITNLQELRLKMAEKFYELENGSISIGEAKAYTGIATAIINACKVEMVNNAAIGVTKQIDFLDYEQKQVDGEAPKNLKDEILSPKGYLKAK